MKPNELVKLFRDNDDWDALNVLLEEFKPNFLQISANPLKKSITSYNLRLTKEQRQDLLGELKIQFIQKIKEYDEEKASFFYYMHTALGWFAHHWAVKLIKLYEEEVLTDFEGGLLEEQEKKTEELDCYDDILNCLSVRQREVIILHVYEQKTLSQTARELGINPSTVDTHYRNALKKLRKEIPPIAE